MASHPSRDERQQELRRELRRQCLPQAYIARLVSELDDHYEDLLEERSTSMGAARKLQLEQDDLQRLGEPAQLALFAAEQYHARSFFGRHPWVTYLLGPLPLVVACWVFFAFAFWAVAYGIGLTGTYMFGWTDKTFAKPGDYIWLQAGGLAFICWYAIVLPPFTAAWMLCRVYRRNALDWRWPVVGCSLLAVVAGMSTASYKIAVEPSKGMLSFGWNFHSSASWLLLSFLPRFALAMGIGLLLVKRAQLQQQLDLASSE